MKTDILKRFTDLRTSLLNERTRLQDRLRDIQVALGGKVPKPAHRAEADQSLAKPKRRLSAAGRARIIAGTKAHWAKLRAAKKTNDQPKVKMPRRKGKLSAKGRAAISAAQKARWAATKSGQSK